MSTNTINIDQTIHQSLARAINATWNAIADDLDAAFEGNLDNEIAMETVLDAERLKMFGGDNGKAHAYYTEMVRGFGYKAVFEYMCKHFKLV